MATVGLVAVAAIFPILQHGPSCGHDFDFHILSWLEAANQFVHFGFPHWAFTPGWNAGEPRFIFYPPLSWSLGAALGLFIPWNFVPAAFTWVALTLSGLTMRRLALRFASPPAALLAATLYLANPYMLFSAYERTAYGELLAAAWLPLLFAAALAPRIRILPLATAVALLWLTNAPAAVMGCYALAFITLIRLIKPSSLFPLPSSLLSTAAGTLLGLALAAFYIVPAAYEQRFVQVDMAIIPGMRVSDHFLFHRMGANSFDDLFHDAVVRTASIIALSLIAAITIALLVAYSSSSQEEDRHPSRSPGSASFPLPSSLFPRGVPGEPLLFAGVALPCLTLLIAFLLTPPSLFLWTHLPKLAFLQFPWRLTAMLGLIFALTVAIALRNLKWSFPSSLFPLPLSLLLVLPAWRLFHQPCDPEDTVPARVALFHSSQGTDPTDEYTPIGIDGDAEKPGDPPYWLTADPNAPQPPDAQPGPAPLHLTLDLPTPEYLVLNLRQYPDWHATLNSASISAIPHKRPDGLLTLQLPAGHDIIDLHQTRTPDQTAGLVISALACLTALGLTRKNLQLKARKLTAQDS